MNLNKFMAVGILVQGPELRFTGSGKAVLNLRLAINTPYKDSNDQWQKQTVFMSAVCWYNAENLADNLAKGDTIFIEGSLQQRSWESDNGKRTIIEIKALKVQYIKVKKFLNNQQDKSSNNLKDDKDFTNSVADEMLNN